MKIVVTNWKRFLATQQKINWQRDFFDHRLLDEKGSYILMNPVRNGLCKETGDWHWIYQPNNRPLI
jgi:hypothetical protein